MKKEKNQNILKIFNNLGFESDDRKYIHLKDMLSENEFKNLINDFIKKELNYQESPIITNQDNFLKLFPDALIECDGILSIKPCELDEEYGLFATVCNGECDKCRKNYWLKEAKEIKTKATIYDLARFISNCSTVYSAQASTDIIYLGTSLKKDTDTFNELLLNWINTH